MMKKRDVSQYKRTIEWCGFNLANGRWSLPVVLYILVMIALITDSFLYVLYTWDNIDKRVDGLRGFVQYVICFTYFLPFLICWEDAILLIQTIDEGFYRFPYQLTSKRVHTEKSIADGITALNTSWYFFFVGYIGTMVAAPVAVFLFRATKYNIGDIQVKMLYSMFPFYFPENYDTLPAYFVSYILTSYFFIYGITIAYVAVIPAFNCMQLISGELKLLRLTIEEMEYAIQSKQPGDETSRQRSNSEANEVSSNGEHNLHKFLVHFVEHHCHINRKITDMIKGMQIIAFSVNSGMSLLICTIVYSVIERDGVLYKLQDVGLGSCLILILYCYGVIGETISTEGENLRTAAYNYPWLNEQPWFKKSLRIVITRLTKPIEIRSVGLFTLNLKNFVTTVQAIYSYYNLLRNLKK